MTPQEEKSGCLRTHANRLSQQPPLTKVKCDVYHDLFSTGQSQISGMVSGRDQEPEISSRNRAPALETAGQRKHHSMHAFLKRLRGDVALGPQQQVSKGHQSLGSGRGANYRETSCNDHIKQIHQLALFPFYRTKLKLREFNNLPKVTKLMSDKPEFKTRDLLLVYFPSNQVLHTAGLDDFLSVL